MVSKIESLKLLIEASKKVRKRGGLSESGKDYLAGLEGAYRLLTHKTGSEEKGK